MIYHYTSTKLAKIKKPNNIKYWWRCNTSIGSHIPARKIKLYGHTEKYLGGLEWSSGQFSLSIMSDYLQPQKPQHARSPCPSTTPRVHPNSCASSRWCHPTISSSVVPFSSCPQSFPIRIFLNESALWIRWSNYGSCSFYISPTNEHPGPISFRMDWLDLLAVQGTSQESFPTPQFKSINSSALSFLHSPTLTSIHDHWKNHSLD